MTANGLMVGNYLKKDGIVVIIDARSIFDMFNDNPKYEPIPITEEWAVKLGFTEVDNPKHYIKNYTKADNGGENLIYIKFDDGFVWFGIQDYALDCVTVNKIKHVHHLQNLYYTLTLEELTA